MKANRKNQIVTTNKKDRVIQSIKEVQQKSKFRYCIHLFLGNRGSEKARLREKSRRGEMSIWSAEGKGVF